MRIIISPAKKMNTDTDSLEIRGLPQYLEKAGQLRDILNRMSPAQQKALWNCNGQIAALNSGRLRAMDLHRGLTPAVLSYDGIQFRHMAPGVFTCDELDYIERHLRILSGFYGMLRPFDGVTPYRLEMQAKLSGDGFRSLYEFWGDTLARQLASETDLVLNLASREYSRVISDHLPGHVRMLTCRFGEWRDGRIIEKGTQCKMARGEMVRFLAQGRVEDPNALKEFGRLHYRFSPNHSDESTYVFLKGERHDAGDTDESA